MRISDWSSDVCSSDLVRLPFGAGPRPPGRLAAAAAVVEEVIKPGFAIRDWGFGTAKACASLFTSQRQHRVSNPVTQRPCGTQLASLLIFRIPKPESPIPSHRCADCSSLVPPTPNCPRPGRRTTRTEETPSALHSL